MPAVVLTDRQRNHLLFAEAEWQLIVDTQGLGFLVGRTTIVQHVEHLVFQAWVVNSLHWLSLFWLSRIFIVQIGVTVKITSLRGPTFATWIE